MSTLDQQLEQQGSEHRIVVGIDGSEPSLAALRWAARQAELTGSRLEVMVAWKWPINYGWVAAIPSDYDPADDAQKTLEGAVSKARIEHPTLDIRPMVVEGHPAPALVHASQGAELLVVGSRGHGEFAGMLLGSVSEHCVANAHCPVLVLHAEG